MVLAQKLTIVVRLKASQTRDSAGEYVQQCNQKPANRTDLGSAYDLTLWTNLILENNGQRCVRSRALWALTHLVEP